MLMMQGGLALWHLQTWYRNHKKVGGTFVDPIIRCLAEDLIHAAIGI